MGRVRIDADGFCEGCTACLEACSEVTGPGVGLFLVRCGELVIPIICRHCKNAPCVEICATQALFYLNSWVYLEPELCIRCGLCTLACPFGAIELNSAGTPVKCNGCISLPYPACVMACPRGIVKLLEE